jgi:hypothetical protein
MNINLPDKHVSRIRIGVGIVLLTVLTGCVGYVDGGYGGGAVVVPGPDVFLFGGDYRGGYDRGHDAHAYGARGASSRGGRR